MNDLPSAFINWRVANAQEDANKENAQRDFLATQLRRKELMENLSNHPGWKMLAEFLSAKAEEAQTLAENAETPHLMATNLMLAKAYRTLVKFPSATVTFAEAMAKQQVK